MRVLMLCIDVLVFIAMILEMYSGIVMSRYVFSLDVYKRQGYACVPMVIALVSMAFYRKYK